MSDEQRSDRARQPAGRVDFMNSPGYAHQLDRLSGCVRPFSRGEQLRQDDRGSVVRCGFVAAAVLTGVLTAQDECTGALPIGNGLTLGTNVGATTSPQTASCGNMGADVWFVYTASCSGVAEATFCQPGSASFDTVVAVFSGSCAAPALIACNDDTCILRSKAFFAVTAGNPYFLAVGGFGGLQGTFALSVTCHQPPPEDDCTGALPLAPGVNGPFSNQFATDGLPSPSACPIGFADLWFTFTPGCAGAYRIETCGGYDTVLGVRAGCGGAELACNDDGPGACAPGSSVQIAAAAGATYFVRVAGATPVRGSFSIAVSRVFLLSYSSQPGPGWIGFALAGGYPNGSYLNAITFNAGTFPNGTFYGLDLTVGEVLGQIGLGYPFVGFLDGCGDSTFAAIPAFPLSGLTIYSVGLSIDAALLLPILNTPPVAYTIP
jgi:hypothetical protein